LSEFAFIAQTTIT